MKVTERRIFNVSNGGGIPFEAIKMPMNAGHVYMGKTILRYFAQMKNEVINSLADNPICTKLPMCTKGLYY